MVTWNTKFNTKQTCFESKIINFSTCRHLFSDRKHPIFVHKTSFWMGFSSVLSWKSGVFTMCLFLHRFVVTIWLTLRCGDSFTKRSISHCCPLHMMIYTVLISSIILSNSLIISLFTTIRYVFSDVKLLQRFSLFMSPFRRFCAVQSGETAVFLSKIRAGNGWFLSLFLLLERTANTLRYDLDHLCFDQSGRSEQMFRMV